VKRLFTIGLLVLCATAHAEFWDGNKIYERTNSSSAFDQGTALGYIMGVADTALGVVHCAPPTSTAGQMSDMVMQHLRIFPERRTKSGDTLVLDVLKAAWPCAAKSAPGSRSL
jgi:hypothetical protein